MYKVAVIEDEDYLRRGLISTVNWAEYGCMIIAEFDNAVDALKRLGQLEPDIIITDIHLPGMSGLDLLENLEPKNRFISIIISGYEEFQYAKRAISIGVVGYLLKPVEDEELDRVLRISVKKLQEEQKLKTADHVRTTEVAKKLSSFNQLENPPIRGVKDKYLARAFEYMEAQYAEELNVSMVAERIGISKRYLHNLFKEKSNYTFLEYLTYIRINKALELMKTTDLHIYEISERVGYKDVRHFSEVFKKMVGMLPSEIRNNGE